ncbi:VOC family protein [bacterium]|jgi:catechol 2,3-dioxygenase-like lactoylglutathione lyase family enzyme|nr:VOC family protein [bacterium]
MLHHISFPVLNLEKSAKIYDAALAALGFRRVWTVSDAIGYGLEEGKDKFAIKVMENVSAASEGFHLAFQAQSREGVQEFYQGAIQNGAIDNGAPGLRTHYGPRYYAAFIIDPDGHRVEAVYNG